MHPSLLLAKMILRSRIVQWRFRRGQNEADFGSTHQQRPIDSSLAYIHTCFNDYLLYGQIDESRDLPAAAILECGPGDNFGVGARLLAAGAASYTGVDPFVSRQDGDQQRRIYSALRNQLPPQQQQRFDAAIDLSSSVHFNPTLLRPVYRVGAGDLHLHFPPNSFDFIISRAVLEQVHDIPAAFASMHHVLKPGGRLIHKIDFSDYGIFSGRGLHPLTQLTFPNWAYSLLAPNAGALNRFHFHQYRQLLSQMGYATRFFITSIISPSYPFRSLDPHPEQLLPSLHFHDSDLALVESIRPRLASPFRALPASDLLTGGIFLSARKPLN